MSAGPPVAEHPDLDGLDPYDLIDAEAARIDAHLSSLDDAGWGASSACEGWTVRDLVGHLAGTEDYFQACLDDRLGPFFEAGAAKGATDIDSFNDVGIRDHAHLSNAEVLATWRRSCADTRARMRARDGGDLATSVGPYPVRSQAFHVATELATHADDLGVPVTADEAADRLAWRVRFSRAVLGEEKPDVRATADARGTRVVADGVEAVVDDAMLVAAVAGRLPGDADLPDALRAALSTMPS